MLLKKVVTNYTYILFYYMKRDNILKWGCIRCAEKIAVQ